MVAIGIDLGTTYPVLEFFKWKSRNYRKHQGNRTMPFMSITPEERLIGGAQESGGNEPIVNTVFDARLIGRSISDPVIQNDLKHYSVL